MTTGAQEKSPRPRQIEVTTQLRREIDSFRAARREHAAATKALSDLAETGELDGEAMTLALARAETTRAHMYHRAWDIAFVVTLHVGEADKQ